jgi:dolichol-phosphate mannosyltransferase
VKTWIVIPTYCERENVGPLVAAIRRHCPGEPQVLIVDDCSPDGTAQVARGLAGVEVLERSGPRGYGHSMREGLQRAIAAGAERVVTMDADLSHDPAILPQMLDGVGKADLVVGSRYCREEALVRDWPLRRLVVSRVATALVRVCTGVALTDPTSGYRCWDAALLRRLQLDSVRSGGFAFLYEMLAHVHAAGGVVAEVPNVYHGRTYGESKMNAGVILEAVRLLPRMLLRRMRRG